MQIAQDSNVWLILHARVISVTIYTRNAKITVFRKLIFYGNSTMPSMTVSHFCGIIIKNG